MYLRVGQPYRMFRFTLTTLQNIGAMGRHSWQSFGLAGGIVRALAIVLPGRADNPISFIHFRVLRCLRERLLVPVEKLNWWDVERCCVVLENLSGYAEGHSC